MTTILNQLPELIAFVQSVQTGSFSAAARSLSTTPSAVSKRVARLEDRLNVRLLQRTTRSLNLITEGTAYYERISRLLAELEDARKTAWKAHHFGSSGFWQIGSGSLDTQFPRTVSRVAGRFTIERSLCRFGRRRN